jgi:hypothetical protein
MCPLHLASKHFLYKVEAEPRVVHRPVIPATQEAGIEFGTGLGNITRPISKMKKKKRKVDEEARRFIF